ncbi:MAG: NADH-quinone oxidoreductase subunit L [Deltaproteobacteria bacterium]|nr:NADH-quinone oxidoreductase subunit L [Deltaproteobacteria bacterium]
MVLDTPTLTRLALAALAAPLCAFAIAGLALRSRPRAAAALVIASGALTALATLAILALADAPIQQVWTWLRVGDTDLGFGVLLDPRSRLMGAVVGVITLLVQIYSTGYMAHDPGRTRFFALLALFEWAMLGFAYAPDLLQAFIFWELVGLASFFLIGFWYDRPEAIAAAKKAFIMTRVGDVAMLIGLVLLFALAGTLDIRESLDRLHSLLQGHGITSLQVEVAAALLFVGVVGKSAQFPLHTWLPDAMAGPTPVSALLHSATMVAAGVFLFARFEELFLLAPLTRSAALLLTAFTALLAALLASVQVDIKRVWAWSSISQLGTMLAGLAAGGLSSGLFHLTTHAAFKALLFLSAGALIHHYGTQDLRALGRAGARRDRLTMLGLLVGAAALAGIPGFAGFASKEAVLTAVHDVPGRAAATGFALLVIGAGFTAYYVGRVAFLLLRPTAAEPHEPTPPDAHGHPPTTAMSASILTLTLITLALAFAGPLVASLLGQPLPELALAHAVPGIAAVALGLAVAVFDFGRKSSAPPLFERVPALHGLLLRGFYVDAIYQRVFVGAARLCARALHFAETRLLDPAADGLARLTLAMGEGTARGQSGQLQRYIGVAALLLACVALWLGFAE